MLTASLILLQVVIFFALIFILKRMITQNVVTATKHLERQEQEYNKKEQKLNQQLEDTKGQAQQLLAQARDEAQKLKADAIKQAEAEKEKILNEARTKSEEIIQHAENSRQMLLAEIDEMINKAALEKASVLLSYAIPEELRHEMHSRWTEGLIKGGFDNIDRLHIPEDMQTVKISSALALTEKQRKILYDKLKSAIGRDLEIKEEIDASVIAGIVITMGSLILDGSLRNKIKEKARNA